jgi:histidinol-phosphate aminotransferase
MSLPVKPWVAALEPYVPGKPIEELERELGIANAVKLASNENPLGPSPRAIEAMQRALANVHRYPDGASFRLREALAARLGVAREQLVFGCGADEILELVAKAFLGPGDECVYAWPSFAMYPIVVKGMGATPVAVPLDASFVHDLDAMLAAVTARTRVVMVCNPNNPTGTSVGRAAFDRFAAALPRDVVLLIDEAYVDFSRRPDRIDGLAAVARRPGTLSARTFSKVAGLAGLRVGYAVADRELAGYLERARHPFNLNLLAEVAALAALDDREHLERTLRTNREGLDYLTRELAALGIPTWPSEANFLLAKPGPGAYLELLRRGVIVRPLGGFGLPEHVRISIGTAEENERLVKALREIRRLGTPGTSDRLASAPRAAGARSRTEAAR